LGNSHHASLAQSNLLPDSIFGNLKNAYISSELTKEAFSTML